MTLQLTVSGGDNGAYKPDSRIDKILGYQIPTPEEAADRSVFFILEQHLEELQEAIRKLSENA